MPAELVRVFTRADGARVAVLRDTATGAMWRCGEERARELLAAQAERRRPGPGELPPEGWGWPRA